MSSVTTTSDATSFTSPTFTPSFTRTRTRTATSSPNPPQSQSPLLNSSSLLFGFVFLAIVIIVMGGGCFYQRFIQPRGLGVGGARGSRMGANGRRGAGVGAGEKERPVLYDVYVGKRDGDGDEDEDEDEEVVVKGKEKSEGNWGGLNVQSGSWFGMKPLSIQLLSPFLDDSDSTDTPNPSSPYPIPLWQEMIFRWLHPGEQLPPRPQLDQNSNPNILSRFRRRSLSIFRPRQLQHTPTQPTTTRNEGKLQRTSDVEMNGTSTPAAPLKTDIQVTVVIAMPTPSRIHSLVKSASKCSYEELDDELVYELGVSVVSVQSDPRLCGFGVDGDEVNGKVHEDETNGTEVGRRSEVS